MRRWLTILVFDPTPPLIRAQLVGNREPPEIRHVALFPKDQALHIGTVRFSRRSRCADLDDVHVAMRPSVSVTAKR